MSTKPNDKFIINPVVILALVVGIVFFVGTLVSFTVTPMLILGTGVTAVVLGFLTNHYLGNIFETVLVEADPNDPRRKVKEDFTSIENIIGLDLKDFKQTIKTAREKFNLIADTAYGLNPSEIRTSLLNIARNGHLVLDEIKSDPSDYNTARPWLNVYLDQTTDILAKYIELRAKAEKNNFDIFVDIRKQTQETLEELDVNFQNLLDRLHANDVKALQVDLEVLKDQLKTERK